LLPRCRMPTYSMQHVGLEEAHVRVRLVRCTFVEHVGHQVVHRFTNDSRCLSRHLDVCGHAASEQPYHTAMRL